MRKKTKVIILGSGLVGAPMSVDLAKDSFCGVTAVDIDANTLNSLEKENYPIKTIQEDLSNTDRLKNLLEPYDFVISAVPGY